MEDVKRILISGGSGFLGRRLSASLSALGHELRILTRGPAGEGRLAWDPAAGSIDPQALEGAHAVIHLAGAGLSERRWSEAYKRVIWSSRIDSTRLLVEAMGQLERPPSVFLSASAVGFYGDGGERELTEESPRGSGFLAELCEAWESEANAARGLGLRVVNVRTGVVLSPEGGALKEMLPPFRLGLGGPMGSGKQWLPWIEIEDWVRALCFCLEEKACSGPFNLVAPGVVRQADFARSLGRAIGRPTGLPTPRFVLRAAVGEMADEALLVSSRALPKALEKQGFRFERGELATALPALFPR